MSRRQSWFAPLVAAAVILGAAACNSDGAASIAPPLLDVVEDGPVVPVVQVETARPGQNLPVLFRNRVNQEFWFNPCERFIERNVGGTWVRRADELRVCNKMIYIILPSADREELVDVPLDVAPGTYRFVFVMMRPTGTGAVSHYPASNTFEVLPAP
jgi:hypothetical protein